MGRRDIWLFLLVALGGAWLVALPAWVDGGNLGPHLAYVGPLMMLTPSLGVLAVRLVDHRVPARQWARDTGLTLGPRPRHTVVLVLLAWFGTVVFSVVVVALSSALGLLAVDLTGFSLLQQALTAQGVPLSAGTVVLVQLLAMVLLAPLINSVVAFGEEWGWRGWLLPRLTGAGTVRALLVSGLVWGVWHAPLTLLGYNYPQLGPLAAVVFAGFCTVYGVVMGWLRLRSGSVWPPVLAHGAFNASAGLPMLVGSAAEPPNLLVAGSTGLLGWVLFAVLGMVVLRRWPVVRPAG
ncbi:abortive infection protein [Saccharopolyspora subtropica]|uniref:Abortive infection protein n=1 Tax=Saccharopolyspora thermophila TaxID=89367 RepID=A0A917JKI3_9PSEU|nr:CPBP family intramembrane glutamic endopeptidase [Saccharopolyspora subtropica]GGI73467.1 abortive infection protein [Saccharopolyspora subtropica]